MAETIPDDAAAPTNRPARRTHWAIALLADAVLVVLFAVLGNISHESGLSPAEVWSTAWPFLFGLALGWWITVSWRRPSTIWPSGVLLVIITVTSGMIMRHFFTDGGVEVAFIIVAALTLGLLMLGRRLVTRLLFRRR
ncbi:MAG: DUF3054 domain-containing protein [Nesterenkonia sp.]